MYGNYHHDREQTIHKCDAADRCASSLINHLHGSRAFEPSRFAAKLPAPPDDQIVKPNPKTLVVTIELDRSLKLNSLADMGSIDDTAKLSGVLVKLFHEREVNHVYRDEMLTRPELPETSRIERTVFIKAPRSLPYGDVAKVIDGLKGAGANPIGLQVDNLN